MNTTLEHQTSQAGRRRFWAFCFNWRQIVDAPDVPVPSPGGPLPHTSAPPPGLGSGAAGSTRQTPTATAGGLVSGSRAPGGPHHT